MATKVDGTFELCGATYALAFTCEGPSCNALTNYPNVNCLVDTAGVFDCKSTHPCIEPVVHTSKFGFSQGADGGISSSETITLPDLCQVMTITTDGSGNTSTTTAPIDGCVPKPPTVPAPANQGGSSSVPAASSSAAPAASSSVASVSAAPSGSAASSVVPAGSPSSAAPAGNPSSAPPGASSSAAPPYGTPSSSVAYNPSSVYNPSGSASAPSAAPSSSAPTITYTQVNTYTHVVTKCPPTVTKCPYGQLTTEVVTEYSTYCPETDAKPTGDPAVLLAPVPLVAALLQVVALPLVEVLVAIMALVPLVEVLPQVAALPLAVVLGARLPVAALPLVALLLVVVLGIRPLAAAPVLLVLALGLPPAVVPGDPLRALVLRVAALPPVVVLP
ncbi:hypothetical protein B0T16DRAFT_489227 [Cercophora newfieldiana]|uniref:Uncharacterized protein n=1 Tax=Cercophora newfieldiana TaxID=92897 RepID=A0AA40CTP2_9PEZI|nr:hypothetical protein B0T16DRAFT_489227 [Cercophora newfieldiana]